jgi:hypothetical protein
VLHALAVPVAKLVELRAARTVDLEQLPGLATGAAVGDTGSTPHLADAPGSIPQKAPVIRDGTFDISDNNSDMEARDLGYGHGGFLLQ